MITEALLNVLALLIGLVDALVPAFELPYEAEILEAADWMGSQVGFLEPVLPISAMAAAFAWIVTTYLPVYFTYTAVRWAYAHIPILGGGA